MHSQSLPGESIADRIKQAEADYPSVRYFQIHFEFLQEQFHQTLRALETMQTQIRQLEQQTPAYKAQREIYAEPLQSLVGHQGPTSRSPLISAKQARRR